MDFIRTEWPTVTKKEKIQQNIPPQKIKKNNKCGETKDTFIFSGGRLGGKLTVASIFYFDIVIKKEKEKKKKNKAVPQEGAVHADSGDPERDVPDWGNAETCHTMNF